MKKTDSRNGRKKLVPARNIIDGVPICEKCKYLGTILTPRLECN